MAVAHDGELNKTSAIDNLLTPFQITLTGKTTAGSNRMGIVSLGYYPDVAVTGITWNGVAMTRLASGAVNTVRSELWYTSTAPPTGASNIVVTFASQIDSGGIGCASYNGVDISGTPFGTPATNTGTTDVLSVTVTSAAGEMVVDAVAEYPVAAAVGAGQTQIVNLTGSGIQVFGLGSYESGAASVGMGWTTTGTSLWATIGVSLKAAAGGGAGPLPFITTVDARRF